MERVYLTAEDISKALGVSKGHAYALIRECNRELQQQGYLTIAGKVSTKYFGEKYYGFTKDNVGKKERA